MGAGDRSSVSAAIDRRWGTPCAGHSGRHHKGMLLAARHITRASQGNGAGVHQKSSPETVLGGRRDLQAVCLEEAPNGLGDLLIARFAVDQSVVGVGAERLELRVKPLSEPLRVIEWRVAVETAGDDEPWHIGDHAPIDRDPGDHLASGGSGLVRLLAEEMLDAEHVREAQVPLVAEQPLRQRLPTDEATAVDLGDLSDLVRTGRWSK